MHALCCSAWLVYSASHTQILGSFVHWLWCVGISGIHGLLWMLATYYRAIVFKWVVLYSAESESKQFMSQYSTLSCNCCLKDRIPLVAYAELTFLIITASIACSCDTSRKKETDIQLFIIMESRQSSNLKTFLKLSIIICLSVKCKDFTLAKLHWSCHDSAANNIIIVYVHSVTPM